MVAIKWCMAFCDNNYVLRLVWLINMFGTLTFAFLLMFLFAAMDELDEIWIKAGIFMTGLGSLTLQFWIDVLFICSIRYKHFLIFGDNNYVIALDKKYSSCLEFFSMIGQSMAFCFLPFCFLYRDYQFQLWTACILGGIALVFCSMIIVTFIIGKTTKKDKKDDGDVDLSKSRNLYISNAKISRSLIVFRGISKRHEHGLY